MSSELEDKVKNIIAEQLDADIDKIQLDSNFQEDLDADSLDIVELVMTFEEEFGVSISDDAAEKITTVRSAIEYIEANT